MLMIHSLFDVRVVMISANFARSVIEVRLKQDLYKIGLIMYLVILHKFLIDIDIYFVQFDEFHICVMYL